jgi:hypothetical protein
MASNPPPPCSALRACDEHAHEGRYAAVSIMSSNGVPQQEISDTVGNEVIYDLLIIAQATAKANVRDVIDPWDLPITKGLQESMHEFRRLDEEIELRDILESLAARPPLDVTLDDETQARLPLIFGGISVALARTFKAIDAEIKAVHTEEWERAFTVFRLLV